jgi:uncharacterized protein YfaS (alpha-2-macroglobulin family)
MEENAALEDLAVIPEHRTYAPGERMRLLVMTRDPESRVVLLRYGAGKEAPELKILTIPGTSIVRSLPIAERDMPNFHIEAFTVREGDVHRTMRCVPVPPRSRLVDIGIRASAPEYHAGEKGALDLRLDVLDKSLFDGTVTLSMYDEALEPFRRGHQAADIRRFFWPPAAKPSARGKVNIRRRHSGVCKEGSPRMTERGWRSRSRWLRLEDYKSMSQTNGWVGALIDHITQEMRREHSVMYCLGGPPEPPGVVRDTKSPVESNAFVDPELRSNFADMALWVPSARPDAAGRMTLGFTMPDNLTTWKINAWAVGHGTTVGQGSSEVLSRKDVVIRPQVPRFLVERDKAIVAAHVRNGLQAAKRVRLSLETGGKHLLCPESTTTDTQIGPGAERKIAWSISASQQGDGILRMKALTDEDSDAVQLTLPVIVHGAPVTETAGGLIGADAARITAALHVPEQRREELSRLELRFSASAVGALVEALPFLVEYPYGCVEQKMNRFLPLFLVYRTVKEMGGDWEDVRNRLARSGRNARGTLLRNEQDVKRSLEYGIAKIARMQRSDNGWGWLRGSYSGSSDAFMTAYVVHGFGLARRLGGSIPSMCHKRAIVWLELYQERQLRRLTDPDLEVRLKKTRTDDLDAFVFMVLVDEGKASDRMRDLLYRDRVHLSLAAKVMTALALRKLKMTEQESMVVRNIEQHLVVDDKRGTTRLVLPEGRFGSACLGTPIEVNALYLKLLAHREPKSEKAGAVLRYLMMNRRNGVHWASTRDTALCMESIIDYVKACGEGKPDMVVEVLLDGVSQKEVNISAENLFRYDNLLVKTGSVLRAGERRVEIRKTGQGRLYCSARLDTFSLEDPIPARSGKVSVVRKYYRLEKAPQADDGSDPGEKYRRAGPANPSTLRVGDLVEVELTVTSENDYQYFVLEDMKAAGLEPTDAESGYVGQELGAYMEPRDEKVAFMVHRLPRGKHRLSYRVRAEIPGHFSALPARLQGMYDPSIAANSAEAKIHILPKE